MCGQCISNVEAAVAGMALAASVFKDPIHARLAGAGLAPPIDHVGRDARTVLFLRSLALDPVAILGSDAVTAADRWVKPAPFYVRRRSLRPMGSHSLLAAQ
jgi:hypothetical protein